MKTTITIILGIAWIIICSLIWANLDKLWLQIVLTVVWLFITWMAWELKHAKEYPPDYDTKR